MFEEVYNNWVSILFFGVWLASISAYLAASRSRSIALWFVFGFFAPIIAIPLIFILGEDKQASERSSRQAAVDVGISNGFKKCPYCAEAVREEAKLCRHCRSEI